MKQKTGDLQAFLEHEAWLRRLARSLVLDDSRADEVVQQVLLSAIKYKPDTTRNLRPWISVVARSAARKLSRSEGRNSRREKIAAKPEQIPSQVGQIDREDLKKALGRFVEGLEEPYRSLVFQHFFEGKALETIARDLGVPSSTVRSRLKRILAEMRVHLDRQFGDRSLWVTAAIPWLETLGPAPAGSAARASQSASAASSAAKGWMAKSSLLKVMSVAAIAVSVPSTLILLPVAPQPEVEQSAPSIRVAAESSLPGDPVMRFASDPAPENSHQPISNPGLSKSSIPGPAIPDPEQSKAKVISKGSWNAKKDPDKRSNASNKMALKGDE